MTLVVKSSSAILLGFTAAIGHADITLNYSIRPNGEPNTVMVSGPMVRTESTTPRGKSMSVYDNNSKTLMLIDDRQKSYAIMNHATIEKQVKHIHELRERVWTETQQQLQKMPREQRRLMERRISDMGGSGDTSKRMPFRFSTSRTSRMETVNGIRCEVYESFRNKEKLGEACIAGSKALYISNSDYQTLQGLFAFLRYMTERFVSASPSSGADMSLFNNVGGLPVKMTNAHGQTMILQGIAKHNLPPELFVVPNGYQRVDLSNVRTVGDDFNNPSNKLEPSAPVYAPEASGAYASPSEGYRRPYGQRGYGGTYPPPPPPPGYRRD